MPASSAWARSTRAQKPWMVEIQADSTAAAASSMLQLAQPRRGPGRFSSSAARSVNVITSRWSSGVPSCTPPRRPARSAPTSCRCRRPAETNTRPRRSIASPLAVVPGAARSSSPPGRCRRPGAGTTRGSVPRCGSWRTSPARIRGDDRVGVADRAVDLRPELGSAPAGRCGITPSISPLTAIPRTLRSPPSARYRPATGSIPSRSRSDQDVQRQLQLALGLDLGGRLRALAGLVVPDHAARGHAGIAVDPVDRAGHGEAVQPQALLQVRRRALGAEPHLVVARHQRRVERRLAAQEALQVALQPAHRLLAGRRRRGCGRCASASCRQRRISGTARGQLAPRSAARRPSSPGIRSWNRCSVACAPPSRVSLGAELVVDLARLQEPLDEPGRRALRELLELGHREPLLARPARPAPPGCAAARRRR